MISKLSNQELDANLKRLVGSERKILHSILEHINEVAVRRLYLEKAHSSLYEYLVKECHYSGSAAMRRIAAARLLAEVPSVSEKIHSGALNLSQIGELTRAIKEKETGGVQISKLQKENLVAVISGKSTAETQKEISLGLDLEIKIPEKKFVQKDDSVRIELTLSSEQHKKLLDCKDLAAHLLLSQRQDISLASAIEHLCDQYLKSKKMPADKTMMNKSADVAANKNVTPKTRREVLNRDACCQFKDVNSGKMCGSTFGLEIDHKKPQWASGDHAPSNLQTLCKAHNNYKYQKESNLRFLRL